MAACIPTMRPFFHRAWRRGISTNKSRSATADPFASGSLGRNRTGHRRVGSDTDLDLDDLGAQDETAPRESHRGIVRTVEASMD
jgi:hypothetical protein